MIVNVNGSHRYGKLQEFLKDRRRPQLVSRQLTVCLTVAMGDPHSPSQMLARVRAEDLSDDELAAIASTTGQNGAAESAH